MINTFRPKVPYKLNYYIYFMHNFAIKILYHLFLFLSLAYGSTKSVFGHILLE